MKISCCYDYYLWLLILLKPKCVSDQKRKILALNREFGELKKLLFMRSLLLESHSREAFGEK